jgi:hypothetical protein
VTLAANATAGSASASGNAYVTWSLSSVTF